MGLIESSLHLAALIPAVSRAELEAFISASTSLQGLGMKVADREVIAVVSTLLSGSVMSVASRRRRNDDGAE